MSRTTESIQNESIQSRIARLSWGVKGALLVGACVIATLLSPVLSFSCARSEARAVSCRVMRHAFGVVPYWWTTIARVGDADSDFRSGGVRRRAGHSTGGKAYYMSERVVALHDRDAEDWYEWSTYADVGAESIDVAIDELVAGKREKPFLGWRANVWTILLVFCGALPFAAAMLSRTACDRFGIVEKRGIVIERTYVVALVLGALFAIVVWWGSIPGFIAQSLGLPTGWSAVG